MSGLAGVYAAAITPRKLEGEVDLAAAFELIDHLCIARVNGIALFTDSGEYPAFTIDERARLTYLAVKRSRVPVLVGVGSATLDSSVALAREVRGAGAAGVLAPPPFSCRYGSDDLVEFYCRFAAQVGEGIELFLSASQYSATGLPLDAAVELMNSGLFAGIHDGEPDPERFGRLKAATTAVVAGHDGVFAESRCSGLGAISPATCAVPELVMALDRAIRAGAKEEIARLDSALREFTNRVERFPEPVALKVATGLRGLKTGPPALPLSAGKQKLLAEFGEWFRGWIPAMKKLSANA